MCAGDAVDCSVIPSVVSGILGISTVLSVFCLCTPCPLPPPYIPLSIRSTTSPYEDTNPRPNGTPDTPSTNPLSTACRSSVSWSKAV